MSAWLQYSLYSCIYLSFIITELSGLILYDSTSNDLFFDRIVDIGRYIDKTGWKSHAIGVLIDQNHVLTSFNPLRELSRTRSLRDQTKVHIVTERIIVNRKLKLNTFLTRNIICARQVIPLRKKDLSEDQWHGTDHRHSPVHDLMVIRLDSKINFIEPENATKYEDIFAKENGTYTCGPLVTEIAGRDDFLGREMRFATKGFRSSIDVYNNNRIDYHEYNAEDNVQVNCDEWLPREWGHFICIRNDEEFPFLGSGAMLVNDNAVFGMGSFVLKKANSSILVFTDVRPYYELIFRTCTKDDGGPL